MKSIKATHLWRCSTSLSSLTCIRGAQLGRSVPKRFPAPRFNYGASTRASESSINRSFSTTQYYQKKNSKRDKGLQDGNEAASSDSKVEDPFDFSELEAGIQKAQDNLKGALSKLRPGGRFNPEVVENLRVHVVKGSQDTERLADLAQVVPRGRTLQVIAGDKEHVKSISSSILGSKLNLNPQPDPQNPQQLNIALPPPTAESRKETVNAAEKAAQQALAAVQNARGVQHKKLRSMQLSKVARPDDMRKANAQMDKIVEKGTVETKKIAESARKVLEAS